MRRERGVDDLLYDTEQKMLRVRISIARFNASKRKRGAAVGKPPESDEPLKYSLLECDWVPRSRRAPRWDELVARHPAPLWTHW